MQSGFTYFENKFGGELLPCVKAFQAASLFHLVKVTDLYPDASTIEDFKAFHFLQGAIPDFQKKYHSF